MQRLLRVGPGALLLLTAPFVLAQGKAKVPNSPLATVPFVGCPSDGQIGPQAAPKGKARSVPLRPEIAAQLAYYASATHPGGVLAPLGWHCFGVYGSSGSVLYVSPDPIASSLPSITMQNGFSGPAIEIAYTDKGGFGSAEIARVIARVFPSYWPFATKVTNDFGPFEFGPDPTDILSYRSPKVVEYHTPGGTEDLGTDSRLRKNDSPIEGVAILIGAGDAPDMLKLSVRLPASFAALAPVIVGQVESEAVQRPK